MPSSLDFVDRVVVVTGAGGGLGRAYAIALAARGARVIVNDLRNSAEVISHIQARGGVAIGDEHDISSDDGARGIVDTAVNAFGRIDAVINNAGVFPHFDFADMPWDVFDQMQKVHTYGPFFVTKYAWPYLIGSGAGRVVMTSAKAALWGETRQLTHYGTAKGAVLGLTRQLAMEGVEHGIRVNAVLPSAITSGQAAASTHPRAQELSARVGVQVADPAALVERSTGLVAEVVAWLCHPACVLNGEFVRAQAGEVRLVSYAMTSGIDEPELTMETVNERIATVVDPAGADFLPAVWGEDMAGMLARKPRGTDSVSGRG